MQQKYKIIDVEPGSQTWLSYRKNKIGASDSASILGLSPWTSAYDLWCEKTDIVKRGSNHAMAYGNQMEPEIRKKISEKLNIEFTPVTIESLENPWMISSLDGLSKNGNVAIEIKCANIIDHNFAKKCKVPQKYYSQLQHQMFCSGLDFIFYASFNSGDLKIFPSERDDNYISEMIEKEKYFYDCLLNFIPPELTDMDYVNRDQDSELMSYILKHTESKLLKKMHEEEEMKYRAKIIELCDNKTSKCNGVKISKVISKGRVNYEDIECLKSIDMDKYRKPCSTSWRIS